MAREPSDNLLLIVVGSDLRAEEADRPLAYRLQQRVEAWLHLHADGADLDIEPVVCTDLWYLNHPEFQARPTICVGGPGVNALSEYFAQSMPPEPPPEPPPEASETDAETPRPRVVLQLDPEFTDLRVCVWGEDHELTAQGLDVFCRDYLPDFLTAVANQVEPKID